MDADRAIAIIETVLAPKSLNPVQIQIIRGVIAGKSYREIATAARAELLPEPLFDENAVDADRSAQTELVPIAKRGAGGYQLGYIRETGAQLWQSLSQRIDHKVTKNSLAAVLLWYTRQPGSQIVQGINLSSELGDTPSAPQLQASDSRAESVLLDRLPAANPEPDRFYGRTEELAILTDWCLYERCRTIFLSGKIGRAHV